MYNWTLSRCACPLVFEVKLLVLTQGCYVKPEEYEQLSTAFLVGSIRNRISVLRIKRRDLYEQLGWTLPEGGAGHSSQKKTPKSAKKRNADESADDAALETPSKKPRVRKGKKDIAVKKEEEDQVMEEVLDTISGVEEEEGVEEEV
ncbi:hypothetical protein COCSADRAFT_197582 [Bipolaris sorokiniana ND90Pr]|uniref:Uncharacterized protein n=1 Tax=Cochliobolus sativus (strain ND90Pr / ATCC 201652) TaxID=665912 RepID=M2SL10_COCSN|nr:uncharacterized protein COCSADRAFT_197582 [Bipolaris sorokiniana ND90Pr]EMD67858.1 hypothetical protein COCSADRAFT_197582 [Bipolaris sorokiniana ND90Pr]